MANIRPMGNSCENRLWIVWWSEGFLPSFRFSPMPFFFVYFLRPAHTTTTPLTLRPKQMAFPNIESSVVQTSNNFISISNNIWFCYCFEKMILWRHLVAIHFNIFGKFFYRSSVSWRFVWVGLHSEKSTKTLNIFTGNGFASYCVIVFGIRFWHHCHRANELHEKNKALYILTVLHSVLFNDSFQFLHVKNFSVLSFVWSMFLFTHFMVLVKSLFFLFCFLLW